MKRILLYALSAVLLIVYVVIFIGSFDTSGVSEPYCAYYLERTTDVYQPEP